MFLIGPTFSDTASRAEWPVTFQTSRPPLVCDTLQNKQEAMMLITTQELVSALEAVDELIDVLTEQLGLFRRPVLVSEHFDKNGEPIDILNQAEALQSWVEWEDRESGQTLIEACQDMAIQIDASEVVPVFCTPFGLPDVFGNFIQESLREMFRNSMIASSTKCSQMSSR
jgi:hypothetical protein